MVFSRQYSVIEGHTRPDEEPFVVVAGEVVAVGHADADWPGWRWCTNRKGKSGWVAERLLSRLGNAVMVTENYNAGELTVHPDEIVEGLRILEGWIWCRNDVGQEGWVPAKKLQPLA
ncbi:MAG: SH3 domain-containing protein [Mycobacterium leprae]